MAPMSCSASGHWKPSLYIASTIGELVAESLVFYGIKTSASADELLAAARAHSGLGEDEAVALANEETRAQRAE